MHRSYVVVGATLAVIIAAGGLGIAVATASTRTDETRERDRHRPARWFEIKISRNISYDHIDGVDPKLLSLDIYTSRRAKRNPARPVVAMIHGGGWRRGDKANRPMWQFKAPHFVGNGFVYVSINYRLSSKPDDPKHPAHVRDVAKALAWLSDHVAEYGGDPDRMFVMGHSAGAHLAALVSTDHRRLKEEGKDLSIIKGTICLDTAASDIPRLSTNSAPIRSSVVSMETRSAPASRLGATLRRGITLPPANTFRPCCCSTPAAGWRAGACCGN